MSQSSDVAGAAAVHAFLARFLEDREAGGQRTLAEYQALFPGHDEAIEHAHRRLHSDGDDPLEPEQRTIGRFRILEELGRGGQGAVYLAEDPKLNRRVALKVLGHGHGIFSEALERFKREAEAASRLDHPGICAVHDAGEAEGLSYIAMQYVEGQTLARRIDIARKAGPDSQSVLLPQEDARRDGDVSSESGRSSKRSELFRALHLIESAARALHVAHGAGVVHRDVKPGNIMVTPQGKPVILDFGLARDEESDGPSLTLSGAVFGTPAYMSPEQIRSDQGRSDRRTDVYSLAATLYECLTLRPPFRASTREGLFRAILEDTPLAPSLLNPGLPPELDVLLAKGLAKAPRDRYATALDLADELQRVRERRPIVTRPPGPWLRLKRWTQRNPSLAAAIGGLFLLLAVGLAVTSLLLLNLRRRASDLSRQNVHMRAMNLASAAADAREADSMLALLLAREAVNTKRTPETIAQLQSALTNVRERTTVEMEFAVQECLFLPSGDRLLTLENWSGQAWLSVLDLEGNVLRRMEHPHFVSRMVASRSGEQVLTAGMTGIVRLWNLDGQELVSFEHEQAVLDVAFSPDDAEGFVLTGCVGGNAYLWERGGTLVAELRAHAGDIQDVEFAPSGRVLATASSDKTVVLWEWDETARVVVRMATLRGHGGTINQVRFLPDTEDVVTCSGYPMPDQDGTVRIWDHAGNTLALLEAPHGGMEWVRISPSGDIVTGSSGGRVQIWSREGRLKSSGVNESSSPLYPPAFSPSGDLIAAGASDGAVWLFDEAANIVAALLGHDDEVMFTSISPDGKTILSSGGDKTVRLWDVSMPSVRALVGHEAAVVQGGFSPDGKLIVTSSEDKTARIWSSDGEDPLVLGPHAGFVHCAEFAPDGRSLLTASEDGLVRIWDLSGTELRRFVQSDGIVISASFSPDGRWIATGTRDGTVSIWSLDDTSAPRHTIATGGRLAFSVSFSNASDRVLVGSALHANLFDFDGSLVRSFGPHGNHVFACQLSSDEKLVLTASETSAFLWDIDGTLLHEFVGHSAKVWTSCFTPDGQAIVTASDDKTARIWNRYGVLLTILRGHTGGIRSVAVSPSGDRVLTSSWDRTARVWITDPDEVIRLAEERTIRDFTADELARYGELLELPGREAQVLVGGLQRELMLKDLIIERLQESEDLDPTLRQTAMRMTASLKDLTANDYNVNAWNLVRSPGRTAADYDLALRQAQAACTLQPDMPGYLNTLGIAYYRNEQFEQAIETLDRATDAARSFPDHPLAWNRVFQAMSHARLGRTAEAERDLAATRELMKTPISEELAGFLDEAVALIEPK